MASYPRETPDHHNEQQQGAQNSETIELRTLTRGLATLERRTLEKRDQYGVMTGGLASGSATDALAWAKKVNIGIAQLRLAVIDEFHDAPTSSRDQLERFLEVYRFSTDFIPADPEDSARITLERLQRELIQWVRDDFPSVSSPEMWFL